MKSPTSLFFIRHGEVDHAYHKKFGGRIDMALSPLGEKQAHAAAAYLQRHRFDAIYASPMKRVQQTLAELVARQGREASVLPGLREVDFGDWTGLGWDEVQARFGVTAYSWLEQLENGRMSGAEPLDHFRQRVEQALQHITQEHPEQAIAIVCHGGVIRMALAVLLQLPLSKTAHFEVDYASITWMDWSPTKCAIQLLNLTPWRDLP